MIRLISICIGWQACVVPFATLAQRIESIGKEKPFSISGSASLSQVLYKAFNTTNRRDPYSYVANGNLNLSIYQWNIPFSYTFSNNQSSFQQPFNRYSISPSYKWVSGHFGYASTSFSSYTVNGHVFLGGVMDFTPEGKWTFSILYGRFLKAHDFHSADSNQMPSFKRTGCGIKASFNDNGNSGDIIFFRASDNANSISAIPDSLNIHPQENLVLGLTGRKVFLKHLSARIEYASSALTTNVFTEEHKADQLLGRKSPLFTPRQSTGYYQAYKSSIDVHGASSSIGVSMEHIDPGYKTLGGYFFNNDLKNLTLNGSASMLHGKVSMAGSVGRQRDNLDKSKVSTLTRTIGSGNVNFNPSERFTISGTYSTFLSFTNIRSQIQQTTALTPYENLDTLNYIQTSRNASLVSNWAFGSKHKPKNVAFNFSLQQSRDRHESEGDSPTLMFYTLNSTYTSVVTSKSLSLSMAVMLTLTDSEKNRSQNICPILSASKAFFGKKLRSVGSCAYNRSMSGESSRTLTARLSNSLSVKKSHHINLNTAISNRAVGIAQMKTRTELTATLGYSYSFSGANTSKI